MKIARIHLLIIIIFSLVIKSLVSYIIGNKFLPVTWEYEVLAQKLVSEGRYEMEYREYGNYKALLAPGYSFLCAGVYKLFGTNHKIMLIIQFLLMTGFSIIIYFLAKVLFNDSNIAFIAGLLSVLHPGLTYYTSCYLHKITLYMPLFYLSGLLFCLSYKSKNSLPFIALGISSGLAILTRATFLPIFVLGLFVYLLLSKTVNLKLRIKNVFIAFVFFFGLNLPWVIRNYNTFGKFIFSQNNKWEAFWVGNNPNSTGSHFTADGTAVLSTKPAQMQAEIEANKNNEIAIEEIFKKYSLTYVKEQPFYFIKGLIRKGFYFWWFYPQTGLFYPKSFLIAYKFLYAILLAFTAFGLYICHRERLWRMEMIFPVLLVFGIWASHTVNFMEMRHRWTVEPVLLIFAAIGLNRLLKLFYIGVNNFVYNAPKNLNR